MRAWIAVFALPLLCWASPARASLVLALDLPTLVTRADHVAVVEVASVKADWDANHEQILSTIDLVVVESWKGGDAPASHITVVQPGGTVGDLTQTVHGMTRFVAGERAVVFLAGRPERASVVGMAQGKRLVRRDAGSGRMVVHAPDQGGRDVHPDDARELDRAGVRPSRAPARRSAGRRSLARRQSCSDRGCTREHDRAQARGADRRGAVKRAALVVAGVAAFAVRRRAGRRLRPLHVGQRQDVQVAADLRAASRHTRTTCSPMMTIDEIVGAVDGSAAAWSRDADACTYLDITVSSSTDATPRATNDGHNNVIFRAANWCKLTAMGTCDPTFVYDPAALALTSVSASTSSGVIRDADIEVNAFHFNWADLVAHPDLRGNGQPYHDLQNALTHEMGHLIGLDHTCYFQGPPPLDNTGAPITDCASASAEVLETTMFPSANPGDIDKRTLAPDDQLAVCEIYPAAAGSDDVRARRRRPRRVARRARSAGAPASAVGIICGLIAAALLAARAPRRRRG